jgi:hypothetical protein
VKIGFIIVSLMTVMSTLPAWAQPKPRTLIAKCVFGDSIPVGLINLGDPFLYIFGYRKIENGVAQVESFEVVHELASFKDDIRDISLPNLDRSKIHSADFPVLNGKVERFSIHWTHASIEGRTESRILNVFDYDPKDHFKSQTNGVASALAFKLGFDGAYPTCFVQGLK